MQVLNQLSLSPDFHPESPLAMNVGVTNPGGEGQQESAKYYLLSPAGKSGDLQTFPTILACWSSEPAEQGDSEDTRKSQGEAVRGLVI